MLDDNLMFRKAAAGALSVTATLPASGLDFGGPDQQPLTYVLYVPATSAGDTLDVKIQESDDDITYVDALVFPQVAAGGTGPGQFFMSARLSGRYRKAVFMVAGNGGENFGNVTLGVDMAGRFTKF